MKKFYLPNKMILKQIASFLLVSLGSLFILPSFDFVTANTNDPAECGGLRGVYIGTVQKQKCQQRIGRLAIQKIGQEGALHVPFNYPFKKGDQFRMQITSNSSGWLYIMHRQKGEDPKLLWPRIQSGISVDDHQLTKDRSIAIPASPNVFIFDEEIGTEYFTIIINSTNEIPKLTHADTDPDLKEQPLLASKDPKNKKDRIDDIETFALRGIFIGAQDSQKNVQSKVSYPGINEDDQYIYFSTLSDDQDNVAVLDFQLQHE